MATLILRPLEDVLPSILLMVALAWALCGFVMWLNSPSFERLARRFMQRLR